MKQFRYLEERSITLEERSAAMDKENRKIQGKIQGCSEGGHEEMEADDPRCGAPWREQPHEEEEEENNNN